MPFLLFTSVLFSQQEKKVDSLNNIENPKKRLEFLVKLCNENATNNSPKNKKYLDELVKLSKKLNDDKALLKAYQNYSTYYISNGNLSKSVDYIKKARNLSIKIKDLNLELECIVQAGIIYNDIKDVENASKIFKEGLEILNNNDIEYCAVYSAYADFLVDLKNDETEGLKYYLKALECTEKTKDYKTYAYCNNGLCWIYLNRKQYDKVEQYALKTLDILSKNEVNNKMYLMFLFERILGRVYSDENKIKKAIKHQKKALEYTQKMNNLMAIYDCYINLSFSYFKDKNHKKSKDLAVKAYKIAIKLNMPLAVNSANISIAKALSNLNQIKQAEKLFLSTATDTINKKNWPYYMKEQLYEELAIFYKIKKDYKKALKYNVVLLKMRDSLNSARFKAKITDAETKYQTEKKEKENLQLKHEKAEQRLQLAQEQKQKWLLAIAFLLSLVTLGVFGYYYRKNQKQKQLIENLQKELHHRVKNNLAIINRFVEVIKEEFNEPKFNQKLTELQNRISSINEVHQQLYDSKNVTNLNMKNYIDKLVKNVADSFPNNNIETNQNVDSELYLTSTKSFPLGIIINEFLTNSYKYAFDNNKGKIDIEMKQNNNNYELSLKDNGKGFPETFDTRTDANFGLRIVKLLCNQIDAKFDLRTNNGVELKLIISN